MKRSIVVLLVALVAVLPMPAQVQAAFSADEAAMTYYLQGWDTAEDFATWTYCNNQGAGKSTWRMAEKPSFSGASSPRAFSAIDPSSRYSLAIDYSSQQKDESAISPEIAIREHSTVEFYVCVYAIWYVNARTYVYITDVETGAKTLLFDLFLWAQEHAYTGPNWEKFVLDLSSFAGKNCRVEFRYVGSDGENIFIDGFRVRQQATSADATVTINEGEQVHFLDESTGNPSLWNWEFEGGTPATSVTKNPVVTYQKSGVYSVKLTARRSNDSSTITREGYIHVSAKAPTALIGTPEVGYLSPYAYCYLPTGVPVQYHDLSSGRPTAWYWTFEGATPETSAEQHPTVTYPDVGTFGLILTVSNEAGSSDDFLSNAAIQAGGTQEVWNILPEETASDNFGAMNMGLYGYYAGTNWLGMDAFAELYHAPATKAEVGAVSVYFYSTATVSSSAPITVSLCRVGRNGMPGTELASATLRADQLAYDAEYVVPTVFQFAKPVTIEGAFFAVISGIPHETNSSGQSDDISIFCIRRGDGAATTTYHYLAEWDDNDQPTGNYTWYKSDEAVSMAVTPHLHYLPVTSSIALAEQTDDGATLMDYDADAWYNLQGVRLSQPSQSGIYIHRGRKVVR